MSTEEQDASTLLDDEPKAATKKAPAKKAPAKKASTKKAPAKKASTKKAPATKKPKPEGKPEQNVEPTLSIKQISVLCAFATVDCKPTEPMEIAALATGKKDKAENQKFAKSSIQTLRKKGIILKTDEGKIYPNPEKFSVTTDNLLNLVRKVPDKKENGKSAGVLGGDLYSEDKSDKYRNIRFGRATGRLLHKLMLSGAVGYHQPAGLHKPKLWYRLDR